MKLRIKLLQLLAVTLLISTMLFSAGCGSTPSVGTKGNQAAELTPPSTDNAKSQLFVEVSWLKNNLNNVIVLDARADKEYQQEHIPGAINAMWQGFANMTGSPGSLGWGTLLPAGELAKKIGALGIDGTKTVIVYADPNAWGEDGRIVWMLKMAGVANSKLLDGGWPAWKAGSGTTTKEVPVVSPVIFKVTELEQELNVTTDWIKANQAKIKIVDSRSEKEYLGATDFGEKRGGHLPGAINIPYKEVFDDDGRVKSTLELKQLFTKAGLNSEDEIAAYCTKGIRSAHMTLLLRMAGFEQARNYDASFYEWAGNEKLPLVK